MPSAFANPVSVAVDTSIGVATWLNPLNLLGDTDLVASCSPGAQNQASQGLTLLTHFGDTVNPATTLAGIELRIERRASSSSRGRENSIRAIVGGQVVGTEKRTTTSWGTAWTWQAFGSPTDTWGIAGLTPTSAGGTDFGVRIQVIRTASQAVTLEVRRVRVYLYWNPYPPEES